MSENPSGRPPIDGGLEYISVGFTKTNLTYLQKVQAAHGFGSFAAAVRAVVSQAEQQKILLPTGTDASSSQVTP